MKNNREDLLYMRGKIYFVLLIIIVGQNVYANAIIDNSKYSRVTNKTSIIYSNRKEIEEDINTYNTAIKEIQKRIEANPQNYILNINLAELYIKTRKYEQASNELI